MMGVGIAGQKETLDNAMTSRKSNWGDEAKLLWSIESELDRIKKIIAAGQTSGDAKTQIVDEGSNPAEIDDTTHTLQVITYEHHEVHSGSHFNYADYALDVAAGTIIDFTFTTPDTTEWSHLTFNAYSSLGITLELYEGATGLSGGTPIVPRNNNRNSTNTSGVTILKDPTITSDGTRASGFLAGGGRKAGSVNRDNEFVLKQNTTYITRITSLVNSNEISWDAEWYEHVDK